MCQMLTNGLRYAAHNAVAYGVLGAAIGGFGGAIKGTGEGVNKAQAEFARLLRTRPETPLLAVVITGFVPVVESGGMGVAYGFLSGACVGIALTALEELYYTARGCLEAREFSNG